LFHSRSCRAVPYAAANRLLPWLVVVVYIRNTSAILMESQVFCPLNGADIIESYRSCPQPEDCGDYTWIPIAI
jgi:hypothetical protein